MDDEKGRIRLLSDAVVDQIAAGEVVERPASVVKELVENALDADARRVRVEVREGGCGLVAVSDDGVGMGPEDVRMSLQRHATSKLRQSSDLERIASFGFRGEALPAIASVSRFRIQSRPHGVDAGYEIRCEGGTITSERAAGGAEGTRVEVADLFYNVPARRKFLKKPGTEWGHIADWMARLALAMPGLHLEVRRDDREALVWPATDAPLDRIAAVLSEDQAGALVPVEREYEDIHIEAYVSSPEYTRPNANSLYLYVNGRPVRDRLLRHALLEAYRDVLPRGRFPLGVLFVTVPPHRVDVNVHPAKWEVRFEEPQGVHQAIRRVVRDAMAERQWLSRGEGAGLSWRRARTAAGTGAPRVGYGNGPGPSSSPALRGATSDWILADRVNAPVVPGPRDAGESVPPDGPSQGVSPPTQRGVGAGELDASEADARPRFGDLRCVGQLLASYLLVESPEGLVVVDQHAAHERILYERLRTQWLERGVAAQRLLVPVSVEVGAPAATRLEEATGWLDRMGFEVEAFGTSAVLVRSVPALLAGRDPGALVREIAEDLGGSDAGLAGVPADAALTRMLPVLDRLFATLACHSARRFGDHLEVDEQRAILEGLDTIPWAPTCPHGRPVATMLDRGELEQRFRRR